MKKINLTVYEKNDLIRFLEYAKAKKLEESDKSNYKLIEYEIDTINHLQKVLNTNDRNIMELEFWYEL